MPKPILLPALLLALASLARADTFPLDALPLAKLQQDWGQPHAAKSVDNHPLTIAGKTFDHGLGTHANSRFVLDLHGKAARLTAQIGVDDEVGKSQAAITFQILGDGKVLFASGVMKTGDASKPVDIDLTNIKILELLVTSSKDNINFDHADWADAKIDAAAAPTPIDPPLPPQYGILTPKPPDTPRINGPRVFAARPGNPFLFTIPATGKGQITFSADNLPEGLSLDAASGRITGSVKTAGTYNATLHARVGNDTDSKPLQIIIGDTIALTPPLGWNSWNRWAGSVDEKKIRAAADAMAKSGLAQHGWTTINIDDAWQGQRAGDSRALQPNDKFPDMKALADYVHGKGLKLGIYSTPWKTSYAGYAGGSADDDAGKVAKSAHAFGKVPFDKADAAQFAAWGIDYLKYDWNPIDIDHTRAMAESLRHCGRDIIYSLSNSADIKTAKDLGNLANCWRTTGDIVDTWASVSGIGFSQEPWQAFNAPGHFSDPDMLVIGRVGWGPKLHPTRLTPNEQYTHITLWSLLSAPMLLGCDLSNLDDFTLSLLTNDEVLAINQDPLCKPAARIHHDQDTEIWCKDLADGSKAIALFNRSNTATLTIPLKLADLHLSTPQTIRDLWQQKDLATITETYETKVLPHGAVLLQLRPAK